MSAANSRGATPQDWGWFEWVLGLGENLLPVVPDENARAAPSSKVSKFGKIPSAYDREGRAHGLAGWQNRKIQFNELAVWRTDSRLGICLRTGSISGIYALDIDVTDQTLADAIRKVIGADVERNRINSTKFLVPIEIEAHPKLKKRIIHTAHGRIECLGDGQQFVAAGTHPTGARYQWSRGLPHGFPTLTLKQFDELWSRLRKGFGTETANTATAASEPQSAGNAELLTEIPNKVRADLMSALAHKKLIDDCADNDMWNEVGYALLTLADIGQTIFCSWSKDVPNYEPGAPEAWWEAHAEQQSRTDYRHIFTLARKRGWRSTASATEFNILAASDVLNIENRPLASSVQLICGTEIHPKAISWLWNGYLARGKLQISAGAPGTSKTTISLDFAATITSGGKFPDGTQAQISNVLMWSGEDSADDTLMPRFLAMGGDPRRIYFVSTVDLGNGQRRQFDPSQDMAALLQRASEIDNVSLIIVDPIVSAVAGDSHKNTETRRALQPLVELAEKLNATLLGISHYTKGTQGSNPIERVTGSIAFGAVARLIFGVAKTRDSEDRIFVRAKSNIGPDGGGFQYRVEQRQVPGHPEITDGAAVIAWGQTLEGSAQELLKEAESPADPSKLEQAESLIPKLIDMKAGKIAAKDLQRAMRKNGFGENMAGKAIRQLIDADQLTRTKPDGPHGEWVYELVPQSMPPFPELYGTTPHNANNNSEDLR